MSRGTGGALVRLLDGGSVGGMTDGQLLDRFATRRGDAAEAAFEALVARHGPMVARVCRGCLRDEHDVEDAFQATFLVLVRRAHAIGERDQLAPWLYGVAHRVARKARAVAARRRGREGGSGIDPPARFDPAASVGVELAPVLHEEVNRLPAKYRDPVILCHLQGLTHAEAAQELAWPVGTVSVRLARARKLLAERLTRRGITATVVSVAATFTAEASAASTALAPIAWVHTAAVAAATAASGLPLATATAVSVGALTLARRTSMLMLLSAWKWLTISSTVALTTATGAALVGLVGQGDTPQVLPDPNQARMAPAPPAQPVSNPFVTRVDFSGAKLTSKTGTNGSETLEADGMVISGKVAGLKQIAEELRGSNPDALFQLRLSGGKLRYESKAPDALVKAAHFPPPSPETAPKLAVDFSGTATQSSGDFIDYNLMVSNPGSAVVRAIEVKLTLPTEGGKLITPHPLPPGITFLRKTRQLVWRLTELEPGVSMTPQSFTYEATTIGQYHCTVEVVSESFRVTREVVTEVTAADPPDEGPKPVAHEPMEPEESSEPVFAPPPLGITPQGDLDLSKLPADYFDLPAPPPGEPASPRPVQIGQTVQIEVLDALPGRPIQGNRVVRSDGTISLGFYGDLGVLGFNRDQIKVKLLEKLRSHLKDNALGLVVVTGSNTDQLTLVPPVRSNRVFVDDQPDPTPGLPTGKPQEQIADLAGKLDAALTAIEQLRRDRDREREPARPTDGRNPAPRTSDALPPAPVVQPPAEPAPRP